MSYDLQIWSVEPAALDPAEASDRWKTNPAGGWSHHGAGWQIVLSEAAAIARADVPSAVRAAIPAVRYLTEMNLEGRASQAARRVFRDTAETLAQKFQGAVVDPQEGTLRVPGGVERQFVESSDRISLLSFTWWFLDNPFGDADGWKRFLALLESFLPEALPTRYGSHEPPPFAYGATGRQHLIDFLSSTCQRRWTIVWYSKRPVREVFFAFPNPAGGSRAGFRANCVFFKIEANVLEQLGWEERLREFWRQLSLFVHPFFGDVRILHGFLPSRTTYASDSKTETHPVKGWFWRGVPGTLGLAAVAGPPYTSLLSQFSASGADDLAFRSVPKWQSGGELTGQIGQLKNSLTQPTTAVAEKGLTLVTYPDEWPFGNPLEAQT